MSATHRTAACLALFNYNTNRERGACRAGPGDMARWKQSWSEEDLTRLRRLAGTKPITMIAKELGRTTGTVLAKAIEQKLPVMYRITQTQQ